jgi:glycosyltransferase involved in cell wall biosynthesis
MIRKIASRSAFAEETGPGSDFRQPSRVRARNYSLVSLLLVRHMLNTGPDVTIIIKALNEERHIATAIKSAIAALKGMRGEIILADSASTDRTVDIAAQYPIKIVSLTNTADRSCGAGVQLGYQYSSGRYICLIDGDMRLHRPFLPAAIEFLETHPEFAGVGGIIVEREMGGFEYVKRASAADPDRLPGEVNRLDCGGVYRREALEATGYMGDRNLHGGEEFELGTRLRALSWRLARIDVPAIDHHGHTDNSYALLRRRWATRFAFSTGEVLRGAFGKSTFWLVLHKLRWELFLFAAVYGWWLSLITTPFLVRGPFAAAMTVAAIALLPFVAMSLRCRSVGLGIYSVAAWNVYAAGLWPGLFRRRIDPARWIQSAVLRDAAPTGNRVVAA